MPSRGGAQHVHVARGGPRFESKTRFGLTGHKIDFAAIRLDVVDDNVAIRSPPFGAIVDLISVQQRCRKYGAVGDAPGKSRRIVTEQRVPDYRVNAVGPNHGIGAGLQAIGEIKPDTAIRALFERDELMIQFAARFQVRRSSRQRGDRRGAPTGKARHTVPRRLRRRSCRSEPPLYQSLCYSRTGDRRRPRADLAQVQRRARLSSHCSQFGCPPDTGEARGLLVDGYVNADPPQRCRGSKATDAGSNDSNRKVVHSECLGGLKRC